MEGEALAAAGAASGEAAGGSFSLPIELHHEQSVPVAERLIHRLRVKTIRPAHGIATISV